MTKLTLRKGWLAAQYLLLAAGAYCLLVGCASGPRLARLTLFVTGNTMGYLENCGCAGGQTGGVHRRARIIREEMANHAKELPSDRNKPNAALLLDCGNFSEPTDPVKRLLSKGVVRSMQVMKYDSVGIGLNELGLSQDELLALLKEGSLPYTAANVEFSTPEEGADHSAELRTLVEPYKILKTVAGFRLGVLHVVDNTALSKGRSIESGYKVGDPIEAARSILTEHRKEADLWVLTAANVEHFGLDAKQVAELPGLSIVFNVAEQNPLQGGKSTEVVFPYFVDPLYDKGKDLIESIISFKKDGSITLTGQKMGVKDTYRPDPEIENIILAMKPEMEALETSITTEILKKQAAEGLKHPVYLGYQACMECHKPIVDQLRSSAHMHAYETLVAKGKQHESCAKCHNVGHNQPGGWNIIEDRQMGSKFYDRRNVQCENCHGPGEYHVLLMTGQPEPKDLRAEGRDGFGLLPASEATCIQCHFGDNDPHWDFKTKWPKIAHGRGTQALPEESEEAPGEQRLTGRQSLIH